MTKAKALGSPILTDERHLMGYIGTSPIRVNVSQTPLADGLAQFYGQDTADQCIVPARVPRPPKSGASYARADVPGGVEFRHPHAVDRGTFLFSDRSSSGSNSGSGDAVSQAEPEDGLTPQERTELGWVLGNSSYGKPAVEAQRAAAVMFSSLKPLLYCFRLIIADRKERCSSPGHECRRAFLALAAALKTAHREGLSRGQTEALFALPQLLHPSNIYAFSAAMEAAKRAFDNTDQIVTVFSRVLRDEKATPDFFNLPKALDAVREAGFSGDEIVSLFENNFTPGQLLTLFDCRRRRVFNDADIVTLSQAQSWITQEEAHFEEPQTVDMLIIVKCLQAQIFADYFDKPLVIDIYAGNPLLSSCSEATLIAICQKTIRLFPNIAGFRIMMGVMKYEEENKDYGGPSQAQRQTGTTPFGNKYMTLSEGLELSTGKAKLGADVINSYEEMKAWIEGRFKQAAEKSQIWNDRLPMVVDIYREDIAHRHTLEVLQRLCEQEMAKYPNVRGLQIFDSLMRLNIQASLFQPRNGSSSDVSRLSF